MTKKQKKRFWLAIAIAWVGIFACYFYTVYKHNNPEPADPAAVEAKQEQPKSNSE